MPRACNANHPRQLDSRGIVCDPAMFPVQYPMNVVADITLILVRPAVLDEMSAHAEKLGMTKLRRA
jgi:hypothetical protein